MLSRAASSTLRSAAASLRPKTSKSLVQSTSRRNMGGGAHWMETSPVHEMWGEAFGFVCWMWIFHRARQDLPVVMGWRHPWEHEHDDHALPHVHDEKELQTEWDTFLVKATKPGEDDDDDDDDEEEDDEDEEDDEE
mmetsp:Transcript_26706/g.37644  ORF Transcript_26706/g.37644 Transcript_26706/m.37644 type:complete len:136 (+) Transcript_26706:55-462(+)